MRLLYDFYNRLEQNKLFIANPQKEYLGELSGIKNLHIKINFNDMSEMTFTIYQYENGEENLLYDMIENKRLVELQNIGWFQIVKTEDHNDGSNLFKNITCLSLENQLTSITISDLRGTYYLYDPVKTELSVMHIISTLTGWNIKYIDNDLIGKFRTFNIDSEKIYSFLMSTLETSFECIFEFDTFDKTISCYKSNNIGESTDIILSKRNILRELVKESNAERIITKLRVQGANGIDISDINPTGTDYIFDLSYYQTDDWMSLGLLDSLRSYKIKYDSYKSSYQENVLDLKNRQIELDVLNNELSILEDRLNEAQDIQGDIISSLNGTPISSDERYSEYMNAVSDITNYTSQIQGKKSDIAIKNNEISNIQTILKAIKYDLDLYRNFTDDHLYELNTFLTEDAIFQDSTYAISETMTPSEIMDMKQDLLESGYFRLSLNCIPQYIYRTTLSNLYTITEDKNELLSYDNWKNNLLLGNYITIKEREDYYITLRLQAIEIDFNDLKDINLTFNNLPRINDKQNQYASILAQANKASSNYMFNKSSYDKAASITDDVQEFMTSTFNATKNKLVNSNNVTTEFGKFGIRNREWLPDQNTYSDYASWWTNNTLLFTDTNWADSKAGIGVFTDSTGSKTMAVMADVICGRLIMSQRLNIINSSGTYSITDETGFTASKDGYSVIINPNTPSEIFKITVNGSNSMYVDTVNKKLVMDGVIHASSGTLGSLNVTGTLTGGVLQGSIINGSTINGGTFYSNSPNNAQSTKIQGGVMTTNALVCDGGNGLQFTAVGNYLQMWNPSVGETFHLDGNGDLMCKSLIVNGSSPLTSGNISAYALTQYNYPSYIRTSQITPDLTSSMNLDFAGAYNAASTIWCNDTFQPLGASDFRLKKNIFSLDNLSDELYMSLKPKQFEFKTGDYPKGINFGFVSQQIENAFKDFNLNATDYNLVQIDKVRGYLDECEYIRDSELHRVNYTNMIPWNTHMIQKLYKEIRLLKNEINTMKANG